MGSSPVAFPPMMPFNPLSQCGPSASCDFRAIYHHHHHHHGGDHGQNSGENWCPPFGGSGQNGMFPWGGSEGDGCGCGHNGGQLSVDSSDNTVTDGQYKIIGSSDSSGTLTVEDTKTGKSFKVWGDPHITTDQGGNADFQHAPATFVLPDGTQITVTPTDNTGANSVNTIDHVTITKGNDAVTMTGFKSGHITTEQHRGEGYLYDRNTDDGTLIQVGDHGNVDDLTLPDGTQITNNNVGNIDKYADDGCHSSGPHGSGHNNGREMRMLMQEINQLEQLIGRLEMGMFGNSFGCGWMSQY
jgi:hypothetical protein